jgi:RimJ/RimL family protein N-acetyltransferase
MPWFNDQEVARTLLRNRPVNLRVEEAFIDKLYETDDVALGIAVREDDRLIGATGLHDIDVRCRHALFGIVIGIKTEWDKGYGTEAAALMVRHAFETLNLNRVSLKVFENNPRGMRAYEKVGFKREGVLRQEQYRDGRYWDTIVMGILREEWKRSAVE